MIAFDAYPPFNKITLHRLNSLMLILPFLHLDGRVTRDEVKAYTASGTLDDDDK